MGSLISQNIPYSGVTLSQQSIPVGMIIPTSGTTVPSGYLKCDGTVYSISLYPHLAAFYESEFGACNRYGGNGTTTFAVPDLCGEFIRGAGTNSHANQGSGGDPGEHQDGTEIPNFYFDTNGNNFALANEKPDSYSGTRTIVQNPDSAIAGNRKLSYVTRSGSDTISFSAFYTSRPTNTSFIYLVKAKPDRLDKITFAEVDDTSTADDVVWSGEKISSEIDRITKYSTTEKVVGKWIDGKKVYQKTINLNSNITVNAGNSATLGNIPNGQLVIKLNCLNSGGANFPLVGYFSSNGDLTVVNRLSASGEVCFCCVTYVKTI